MLSVEFGEQIGHGIGRLLFLPRREQQIAQFLSIEWTQSVLVECSCDYRDLLGSPREVWSLGQQRPPFQAFRPPFWIRLRHHSLALQKDKYQ